MFGTVKIKAIKLNAQAGVTVLLLVLQVARDQARQHQLVHRSVGRTVEDTHHH